MKYSVHILVSRDRLPEGKYYIALCHRPIIKAHFVVTDCDLAKVTDFFERLGHPCRKCVAAFYKSTLIPGEMCIYGAVDGALVRHPESEAQ